MPPPIGFDSKSVINAGPRLEPKFLIFRKLRGAQTLETRFRRLRITLRRPLAAQRGRLQQSAIGRVATDPHDCVFSLIALPLSV